MGKKWTSREDDFLVACFDFIGPAIGPRDLGRTEIATKSRVKKLKKSCVWEAYKTANYHRGMALVLAGHTSPEFCKKDHPITVLKK